VETWDAIRARRNVRDYAGRPLAGDQLDRILEAGRRSPSAANWQPWDFVVVTSRERLTRLSQVWRGAGHVARSAATIAVIGPVSEDQAQRDRCQYDMGQATMSMMLAAADLGIGSGHAAVADQALARDLLGFPAGRFCAVMIALGYPAGPPLAPIMRPNRRPFDEVVHREHW
jgi:nitroreductase